MSPARPPSYKTMTRSLGRVLQRCGMSSTGILIAPGMRPAAYSFAGRTSTNSGLVFPWKTGDAHHVFWFRSYAASATRAIRAMGRYNTGKRGERPRFSYDPSQINRGVAGIQFRIIGISEIRDLDTL